MARPIVGIIGNHHLINDEYPAHAGGTMNSEAVAVVSDCVPLVIPADPRFMSVNELLEACDGFLLTGGRPNVHPEEYGEEATEAHGAFDRARDAIALPLVRACVERGPAVPRHLPRVPGGERGDGRYAPSGDPRPAGADEPPHAAGRHAGGEVRAAPQGDLHRGRAVPRG